MPYYISVILSCLMCYVVYALICKALRFRRWQRLIDKIPGEPKHWLYGNLHTIPSTDPTDLLQNTVAKWVKEFPRIIRVWTGPFDADVLLFHPETAKDLLQTTEPKGEEGAYAYLKPWLGNGLLLADGNQWLRNRRLLTPVFHFENLNAYFDVYNEAADKLLDKLTLLGANGKSIEITKPVSLCTLNILIQCVFSDNSDVQIEGDSHPYVNAVSNLTLLHGERETKPQYFMLPDWIFNMTKLARRFKSLSKYVHQVAMDVISRRKIDMLTDSGKIERKRLDFLDRLLSARDADGQGLSDLEIRQEVDTFMFAGHDTTSAGTSWTLYSLAKSPEHQQRVFEEVDSLMKEKENHAIGSKDVDKLKYLSLCIKEAFRMHTPIPLIARYLSKDIKIDGYTIPKDTQVIVALYQIHHNPLVWEDHLEYKPERFLLENSHSRDPYAFIPFSAGPRNCIGQNFAIHEMKTIVSRIIHRFKIELDTAHKVEHYPSVVMRSRNGIKLKLTPRH